MMPLAFVSLFLAAFLLGSRGYAMQGAEAPRIAYQDLLSGPATGGEGDQGAIVTLFGSGFGLTQSGSRVLLGTGQVGRILQWTDSRISFQVGREARSGSLHVVTSEGESNSVPFTVRQGSIHFVATRGQDKGPGSWASPWRTLDHAVVSMKPGDITYVLDQVQQTELSAYHAALSIQTAGTSDRPIALVVYPGARAVIGDVNGEEFGARTPSIHGGPFNDWTIAGFVIRGANTALRLDAVSGWRIVNNDFSCPKGDGAAGCVEVSGSTSIAFLGNMVHDSGRPAASKRYQSVYFTTDSNHIDVGWNKIEHNHSCRGIQFHSSPVSQNTGFNQYDLLIHDNRISDQVCDGINLATIDPSKGRIAVFNNLIFHVGVGPAPPDGDSSYACINSPGIVNRGVPGTGTVQIYNNTLSDCGSEGGPSAAAFSVGAQSPDLLLKDNLIDQRGRPYFTVSSALQKIQGSGNLWAGGGESPRQTSHNIEGIPRFTSGPLPFVPTSGSPVKHAARGCLVDYDLVGRPRDLRGGCSVGALE